MNEDRPTIGHVLHQLNRAGAEMLAADLARKLRDRYRFIFLCLDGIGALGEELAAEGFTVVELDRKPGIDWKVANRLRTVVKQQGIHLLHAHQYTPFFYASCSRRFSVLPPILFTEHGRHYPDQRKPKRVLANRWLIKPHDRVTAVGRFVKQALIDNEGIAEGRIKVIYNGIDPDAFPPAGAESRKRARQIIGVDDEVPLLMQVARFHSVKDHATAIRAMAQVAAGFPQAKLCLIGEGDERSHIEALVSELDIRENVIFMGARADVAALLPAADVFVLSSLSEGISVTLLEAMATGLPIAATEVGGNPEVVEHEETGLLSPRQDNEALAMNLMSLLDNADRRRAMGNKGRARLLETFTQERMHQQYTQLYSRLLGMDAG